MTDTHLTLSDGHRSAAVIPKSVTPSRIETNSHVFDFDAAAMARLDDLERGERLGPDPASFSF